MYKCKRARRRSDKTATDFCSILTAPQILGVGGVLALRVVRGGSCRSASFRVVGLAFVALVAPSALAVVVLGVLAGVLGGVTAWRDDVNQLANLVGQRFHGLLHVGRVRFGSLLWNGFCLLTRH